MKYASGVIINKPREEVIELFDNSENHFKWMRGLKSFETFEGNPGQPGAKSKIVIESHGRKIEMIETITHRNLPDEYHGSYETNGIHNIIKNYFLEEGNKTKWIVESEFVFKWYTKILYMLMKSQFQKATLKSLDDFKEFAEKSI